ncbi:MAG: DUF6092 family protein [Nocardiopsaceae bacterium]|jgi:hypothetical protein|nr:DUF6092 family protein [Nocardiopsaceae bacterium]
MSQQPGGPGGAQEPSARVPRERAYELLAHLVASAEICVTEPHYYGSFRLLDAAAKLAAALLECGLEDPWLASLQAELDRNKVLMMSDRPAFYSYLPQASRQVAQRLLETAGDVAP